MNELLAAIPGHILRQPCTDCDQSMRILMMDVSKKTNVPFKMLGRYLDVEESDLHAIEQENVGYHSTQERKYQVLLKWVNTHGENATVQSLIGALVNCDDRQAVEFVCSKVAPREDVTRAMPGGSSFVPETPPNACPVKVLPSPFGSSTPSSSTSEVSTPARTSSTPSGLLYQLGQSESLPHASGRLAIQTSPMAVSGDIAHSSSTPADPVTLPPTNTFGTAVSETSGQDDRSHVPSTQAAEPSSSSEMADLGVVRPECQRPSTLPVHSPHVPFGVQATREDPTPFDSMPRCSHGIGQWLQHQMEQEIRKSYSQIESFSNECRMLQSQMDSLALENKIYKENCHMQQEKIRQLAFGSCHMENAKLRTELEMHENLLTLICQSLQVSKQDFLKACNLKKMASELGMMIKSAADQCHPVPPNVLSLHAEYNHLLQQKLDLEGKLDDVISLFSKKQQELEAVMEEKKELEDLSEENETAFHKLQEEVFSTRKFWVDRNKELEAKVAALESLNQDLLEENRKLQVQNQELKENRLNVVPSKEVLSSFGRSFSDGSYHLASLEKHVTYRTTLSLDNGLAKHKQSSKGECPLPPTGAQASLS